VVNEYLDKSNKRSRELYERCKDGGVRCAGMEEGIDVSTNIARAKYDTSGRLFLGDALQDDDTIKIVNYVNERDLTFLKDRVSATDRMLYQASDITNWPFLIVGGRNLITNNSKEALLATGVTTGGAYYFGKVNGEEDPALSALTSRTASIAGYKTGNKVEEKFNLYFNPAREKYRWIDSGYLGISYQHKPSTIPSSLGNIFDSATSEAVGKELNNKENKK
jgi:palA